MARGLAQLPPGLEELGLNTPALLLKDTIGTCEDSFYWSLHFPAFKDIL